MCYPTIIVIRHNLLLKATNQIQAHNLRLFCPGASIRLFKEGFQKGFVRSQGWYSHSWMGITNCVSPWKQQEICKKPHELSKASVHPYCYGGSVDLRHWCWNASILWMWIYTCHTETFWVVGSVGELGWVELQKMLFMHVFSIVFDKRVIQIKKKKKSECHTDNAWVTFHLKIRKEKIRNNFCRNKTSPVLELYIFCTCIFSIVYITFQDN